MGVRIQTICYCLAFILFVIGFCVFIIISSPSIYIQDLYVPALNKTATFNDSVFVDLKFERKVAITRYPYEDFEMKLLYGRYQMAANVVRGFSMGRKKRVHVKAAVEAGANPWEEASRAASAGKGAAMMVELTMPDEPTWVADVVVDASGHMVGKKPVEFWCRRRRLCQPLGRSVQCDFFCT